MRAAAGEGCEEGDAAGSARMGRGPARFASEGGGAGEAAGVGSGVGSGAFVSASAAGGGAGAAVGSLRFSFGGCAGSAPMAVVGSVFGGEGRASAIFSLDSQWESGNRRDQIQSPALNTAQKSASQEMGL